MKLDKDLASYKEVYDRTGIVNIPGVFSKEEVDQIRDAAYALRPWKINLKGYFHKALQKTESGRPALMFFPAIADATINKFRTDERLAEITRYFLGGDVKQVNNQIYFREKGDGDEFAWHQDVVFRTPRDRFPGIGEGYLQTLIVVDDIHEDGGAIEFIDGSHLEGEKDEFASPDVLKILRTFDRRGLQGKKYSAKAGDVMLWSSLTVHGSEQNVSNHNRMTYMNGFARAENCLDYPWYMKDGKVVEKLNVREIP